MVSDVTIALNPRSAMQIPHIVQPLCVAYQHSSQGISNIEVVLGLDCIVKALTGDSTFVCNICRE